MSAKQKGVRVRDGFSLLSTRRTLPMALLRAREGVMLHFRPMLNRHDITEQQWRVIRVLQEFGPTDASRLAELASVLPSSLTRILKALDAREFVVIRRDTQDGRRTLISLTKVGARFLRQVAPEAAAIYARIEKQIGAERISMLLNELGFLLDHIDPHAASEDEEDLSA